MKFLGDLYLNKDGSRDEIRENIFGDRQQWHFGKNGNLVFRGDIWRENCTECEYNREDSLFCALWNQEFGYSTIRCTTPRYFMKKYRIYEFLCKLGIHKWRLIHQRSHNGAFFVDKSFYRCRLCYKKKLPFHVEWDINP